jgi:hypothetical protein
MPEPEPLPKPDPGPIYAPEVNLIDSVTPSLASPSTLPDPEPLPKPAAEPRPDIAAFFTPVADLIDSVTPSLASPAPLPEPEPLPKPEPVPFFAPAVEYDSATIPTIPAPSPMPEPEPLPIPTPEPRPMPESSLPQAPGPSPLLTPEPSRLPVPDPNPLTAAEVVAAPGLWQAPEPIEESKWKVGQEQGFGQWNESDIESQLKLEFSARKPLDGAPAPQIMPLTAALPSSDEDSQTLAAEPQPLVSSLGQPDGLTANLGQSFATKSISEPILAPAPEPDVYSREVLQTYLSREAAPEASAAAEFAGLRAEPKTDASKLTPSVSERAFAEPQTSAFAPRAYSEVATSALYPQIQPLPQTQTPPQPQTPLIDSLFEAVPRYDIDESDLELVEPISDWKSKRQDIHLPLDRPLPRVESETTRVETPVVPIADFALSDYSSQPATVSSETTAPIPVVPESVMPAAAIVQAFPTQAQAPVASGSTAAFTSPVVEVKAAGLGNPLITDSALDIDDSDDYQEEVEERGPRGRSIWFILVLFAVLILQMLIVSYFVNTGILG